MTYTDEQLRRALAKMLPDEIIYDSAFNRYHWIEDSSKTSGLKKVVWPEIRDTELLHLCWLVEETFIHRSIEDAAQFWVALRDGVYRTKHSGINIENAMIHASWQQRTIALAKVKGVEVV